jgi:hypothetical protein
MILNQELIRYKSWKKSFLQKRFANSVARFWAGKVIPRVIRAKNEIEASLSISQVGQLIRSSLEEISDRHFTSLMRLGLFEGLENPRGRVPSELVEAAKDLFLQDNRFQESIDLLTQRLTKRVMDAVQTFRPERTDEDLKEELEKIARAELSKFNPVIFTFSNAVVNKGRELEFRARDPGNNFLYIWSIRKDSRTSPVCLEIDETMRAEMRRMRKKGIPLDRLKMIVESVAVKHQPGWIMKDWMPHYHCRSGLVRVV